MTVNVLKSMNKVSTPVKFLSPVEHANLTTPKKKNSQ